ncbi:MAG: hypothetical protein ACXWDE_12400 [Aeromicrobium sp.]
MRSQSDREVREPLALIDEIEQALGMAACPFTWPVGMGRSFGGIYDLHETGCACSRATMTATASLASSRVRSVPNASARRSCGRKKK